MKFEVIDKKLREVGLRFNKPTIERKKNKWHFELRIETDYKDCLSGGIHYLYRDSQYPQHNSIGHFIASGDNLNKLVTILFERIKSNESIYQQGKIIDDKVVWVKSIVTWNEVEKKFYKSLVD